MDTVSGKTREKLAQRAGVKLLQITRVNAERHAIQHSHHSALSICIYE